MIIEMKSLRKILVTLGDRILYSFVLTGMDLEATAAEWVKW